MTTPYYGGSNCFLYSVSLTATVRKFIGIESPVLFSYPRINGDFILQVLVMSSRMTVRVSSVSLGRFDGIGSTVTIFSYQRILRDRADNGDPVLKDIGVNQVLVDGWLWGSQRRQWYIVGVARAATNFFKWALFFILGANYQKQLVIELLYFHSNTGKAAKPEFLDQFLGTFVDTLRDLGLIQTISY